MSRASNVSSRPRADVATRLCLGGHPHSEASQGKPEAGGLPWTPRQREAPTCLPGEVSLQSLGPHLLKLCLEKGLHPVSHRFPTPGQQGGVAPPKPVLRLAESMPSNVGVREAVGGIWAHPGGQVEAPAQSGTAPASSRGCRERRVHPQPIPASSPREDPDFVDRRQGGRQVELEVSVVHPGLAESPRGRVVLPVVVPVPSAVCPEAVQVHLGGKQR